MMKDFLSSRILLNLVFGVNQYKDGKLKLKIADSLYRPKMELKVWRLDQYGKLDTIAYGCLNLPCETGSFDLDCPTWRPMTGWREESFNFYLGGPPKLINTDPLVRDLS